MEKNIGYFKSRSMSMTNDKKISMLALFTVFLFFSDVSIAKNCYVIKNNTEFKVYLSFTYNTPIGSGMPLKATLPPSGQYPNKSWCFDIPNFKATVSFTGGGVSPRKSWKGLLVLGDGPNVKPSGTYFINPTPTSYVRIQDCEIKDLHGLGYQGTGHKHNHCLRNGWIGGVIPVHNYGKCFRPIDNKSTAKIACPRLYHFYHNTGGYGCSHLTGEDADKLGVCGG